MLFSLLIVSTAFAQKAAAWEKFSSVEGRFSILFPSKPTAKKEKLGETDTAYTYTAETATGVFVASYMDLPGAFKTDEEKNFVLDGGRDGSLENIDGKLLYEKKITLSGYLGREFSISMKDKGLTLRSKTRLFLVGQRAYQLLALVPEENADSPDIDKFLSSFELNK
jgi:hypothetical protein